MIDNRELVLGILLEVTQGGEYSHIAIRNTLEKYQYLGQQERKFIKRVCEGTLEHMIWIDYVIDQFSKVKTGKMKPAIRCILRSGVYELKYMDAVPASATCNEAVKLAQKKGFYNLKGFVNGILRNISRNLDQLPMPDREREPLKYLSIAYSMPMWILELWKESYSMEQMEGFLKSFLTVMRTSIRTNTLQVSASELKQELTEEEIQVEEQAGIPDAFWIGGYDFLGRIPAFQEGKFYVQDASSMKVALWADPKPGDYVMDVCAAPGGKSIHLAQLMQGSGTVEARDLTEYKVSLIQENAKRCQMENVVPVVADARVLDESKVGKADIVIADLPCSGLGVLGKRPDIKYKMTLKMCQELTALQKEILHTVQQYVKPGGILIYSTCTIHRAENEDNVSWFLQEHPSFVLEKQQQILPEEERNDGFFLAKFQKAAAEQENPLPQAHPLEAYEKIEKIDLKSMDLAELQAFLESLGEKPYRAKQVYHWIHKKHISSFAEMTDISKKLIERLQDTCTLTTLRTEQVQCSRQDQTRKYLFALEDGNMVETVRMRYEHGNSVCISSQAGCRMGCKFCASAIGGLVRCLTPGEMLDQVYRVQEDIGERVSHVVVMGTGEPLDNYENLVAFIRLLSDQEGNQISQRNITVSTCGLAPEIYRLAEEKLQITLALSLHAPTQKKRLSLMPIAKKYGIHEVIDACKHYFAKTGRRVTFEYSLMAGVNDSPEDARQLAGLLRGMNCHVNLIPVNPIRERDYVQPKQPVTLEFKNKLEIYGINVTIRREMGRDIDGACGQLRKRYAKGRWEV